MNPTPDSILADPQQTIADLRQELAQRTAELTESEAQKAAMAEVLGVINSSPGHLKPVFDAIVERALRLCDAQLGALAIFDKDHYRALSAVGPPQLVEFVANAVFVQPGSILDKMRRGEDDAVQIADLAAFPPEQRTPGMVAMLEMGGARTSLWVSLRKDNIALGFFAIYRQEVRPFSDKQIALLQNFAAQAVIAMENARLLTETREALEQQTATAEVLSVINSSPGDLAPVFDAILEKALALCEASFGGISTYDGEQFHVVARRGATPEYLDFIRTYTAPPLSPNSGLGRIARGERIVHIVDMADDDLYRAGHPLRVATVDLLGGRTCVWVALHKEGRLLGMLNAYRRQVRPFTDKQIALLQNFAAQAVIAMENARLLTETREALEQQTATAEVLGVINSSPGDLIPVFDAILEKAHSLCGIAHGSLQLFDGERFRAVAVRGLSEAFADVLRRGSPAFYNPMTRPLIEGARFSYIPDMATADYAVERTAAETEGIRTLLCVPLRRDGQLLGMISSGRKEPRPFSEKEIALLENFAAQAVIAMENARLMTETREALEQQTATAEVLGVINSSPGDLTPVFDAMLDKAMRLCGAAFGMMGIRDGDKSRTVATRGVPDTLAEFRRQNPAPPTSPIWSRVLKGEPVIHTVDLKQEQAYESGDPQRRALVDLGGARTSLAVTLMKDRTVLGAINVYRQEVHPFSDKQIALLQNFAAQAVIAIENARLLDELRQRTDQVAELNRGLEARVAEQVDELGRVGRLKRFLAPQLAELIVSQGDEKILESHRREIVVVFCDLRGYTAFTETAEPEEVLDFLRQYHGALGPLVSQFEGTLDQFSGDGIMVFFNDPVPCPDPAERAVKMAMAMREAASNLIAAWRRHGSELGFGAGIAQGYATLGQIGFSDRSGYTAIGTVCNLAARLCAEAKDGQILVSSRIAEAVGAIARLEDLGNLDLKGLRRPVTAFNIVQRNGAPDARPNLTVVATEPGA